MPKIPSPETLKPVIFPAPLGGINAVDLLAGLPLTDSVFQYNLIPTQYGCRVRTGYRPWATGMDATGIRTILPFTGSVSTNNKLFAAGKTGIYDVTTSGTSSPAHLVTFGSQGNTSGYGGVTSFTTIAGHYLVYCDEMNGYFNYPEAGAWASVTMGSGGSQVSGVDPSTFVWAVPYQSRLWFVQRNSSVAYYLPTDSVFGAATAFDFGNKFKYGGYLVGLYTWTFDGGDGINDYLVAVSSGGDVIIYQGSDPTTSTGFAQVGQWYIGPPPAGRRIAGSFGGDLYILSSYGLIPLTRLIAGILVQEETEYITAKITPIINTAMGLYQSDLGWEVRLISGQSLLLISVPLVMGSDNIQYVQYLNSKGWATYRGIPYNTGSEWQGSFYIGDNVGNVHIHTGNVDNGSLSISWSYLSSFQDLQEPGRNHRVSLIRPVFLSASAPAFSTSARYDYSLSEVSGVASAPIIVSSLWDTATWDSGQWTLGQLPSSPVRGGGGLGRAVAIGINGSSSSETVLLRTDVLFNSGNFL